ncbi:hypothetical protein HO447_10460 [Streptococcus suis]|nr:hypothetical protein [Streptococcus suis]
MIEITLVYKGQEIDIVISKQITMQRLRELLLEMFRENKVNIENNFTFRWLDKQFQMGELDMIADFRISNGDRLELVVGE